MTLEIFNYLIWGMTIMAVVVFVSLYFVNAGYGQFRTKQWGWSLNNKIAWVLMEAPVFIVMLSIWLKADAKWHVPELILFCMFQLHYFQRSFIFPFLITGKSRMPIAIMLMGIIFNVINGVMQGGGLFWYSNPDFALGASYLTHWNFVIGTIVFVAGLLINWHSDYVIRHLRKPGDTNHYLPQRGMYKYVTSANYLGELMEWVGFAIACNTLVAWVFPIWTAANLVPRAHAIHKRYRQEFGDDAVGKRKRVIPFFY